MLVMSSTTSAIHASSATHTALLNGIAELDYAPPALSQCSTYVADLRAQKARSDQELKGLKKSTEKERNEHLEIQKSIARKWSNRLVGRGQKFKERVSKEEREYMEALEHEQGARTTHERLLADLAEAENNERDLQAAVERRNGLQRELDALYERIFAGSTPEFPQEDVLEDRVSAAQAHNYEAQAALTFESQTLSVLGQARRALDACAKQMLSAKDCSTWDVWGGGVGADLMEREGLFNAANAAAQFENLYSQAQRMNGAVRAIPLPQIPKPSTMDLVFDNIFTDLEMHDKIKRGVATVEGSISALNAVCHEAQQRVEGAGLQAGYTADALARARRDLHEHRGETIAQVLQHSSGSPQPGSRSTQGIAFPSPRVQDEAPPPFAPSPVGSFSPPPGAPPGHPDATSAPNTAHTPPPNPPQKDTHDSSFMLTAASPGSTTRTLRLSSKNPYAALLARKGST